MITRVIISRKVILSPNDYTKWSKMENEKINKISRELYENIVNYIIRLRKSGCPDNTIHNMITKKYNIDDILAYKIKNIAYKIIRDED